MIYEVPICDDIPHALKKCDEENPEINILPYPLDRYEENKMIENLKTEYAGEAKNILIEHNLRLVVHIAKKFKTSGSSIHDLISVGTVGLIKAVNTFSPEKNVKLATYASKCIKNEMLMYLRKEKKLKCEISLEQILSVNRDGGKMLIKDILESGEDAASKKFEKKLEKECLVKAVQHLSERERRIIDLRFGLTDYGERVMTQKEVAVHLKISQSTVSRTEKKIMERLKKEMNK